MSETKVQIVNTERRYDIDWIRVIVFDILIVYHVCMFFVHWEWHIKNNEIVGWIEIPMKFVNQWRIPILFVVSGMGTRFAMAQRNGKEYIKERFFRLMIPLIAGILIVIPPQVYIERIIEGQQYASYFSFYPKFFEGIYPVGNLSWHHLWFLPYLLTMSLLAIPLFLHLRKKGNPFIELAKQKLTNRPIYLFFPIIILSIPEFTLHSFPITHAYLNDWYCWGMYSCLFVFGYLLICLKDVFWNEIEKLKYVTVIIGAICFTFLIFFSQGKQFNDSGHCWIPFVKVSNMWSWILAIFAWAANYFNKQSGIVAYRNIAVYPFYILHQTIIVVIGYKLKDLEIHYGIKMIVLIVLTYTICWVLYECLVKNLGVLKPIFGVKIKQ